MPLWLDLPKTVHFMFSLSHTFHACRVNSLHKTTARHFKTVEPQILAANSLDLLHAPQFQIGTYRMQRLAQQGSVQVQKCSS